MTQHDRKGLPMRLVKGIAKSSVILTMLATTTVVSAGQAAGTPLCEHRSAEHAAKSHTTREGDSRWHVLHGQLPTCNLDKSDDKDDNPSHDDDSPTRIPRRDHHGFHCTWHGCG